jgi:hypothetical protein
MNNALKFTNKYFKDKRIRDRFDNILEAMYKKPNTSLSSLSEERKDTVGVFRFLSNSLFDVSSILNTYFTQVKKNLKKIYSLKSDKRLLIIQDTTSIDLSGLEISKELGYLAKSNNSFKNVNTTDVDKLKKYLKKGIDVHSAICVTPDGEPVDLISQKYLTRDFENYGKRADRKKKPVEKKEIFKWIETVISVLSLKLKLKLIFVGDRESDFNEFMTFNYGQKLDFVIRARIQRLIQFKNEDGKVIKANIKDWLLNSKQGFEFKTLIPRSREENEKEITLKVRYRKVSLIQKTVFKESKAFRKANNLPTSTKVEYQEVPVVNSVYIENTKEGISWLLFTTLPIDTDIQVLEIIKFYKHRWLIERFHYILKSGFLIENIQLKSENAIKKVFSMYSINAMRILRMTILSRTQGQRPCTIIFKEDEWKAIYISVKKSKIPTNFIPSLNEITKLLAKLGGFQGRKNDGEPGAKVIWRGLFALNHILKIYPLLVCKG